MKKLTKVSVLGTDYTIYVDVTPMDKSFIQENDGVCDSTTKEIFISDLNDGDPMNMNDMEVYERKIIRHEVIHAILFESGLDINSDWGRNEEIIDWIAIQYPKLSKIFKELEVES